MSHTNYVTPLTEAYRATHPEYAQIYLAGHRIGTLHPKDPLIHWLNIAAEWHTYTPKAQDTLRPIVKSAVVHLFNKFAKEYEPSPVWYANELYEGGLDSLERIGGTWNRDVFRPYLAVLMVIGVSDDEGADLIAPGHAIALGMASGDGPPDDELEALLADLHATVPDQQPKPLHPDDLALLDELDALLDGCDFDKGH